MKKIIGIPIEFDKGLKNAGVHVVLTGTIGEHAQDIFSRFNIQVYEGAKNTVKETLKLYSTGKLPLVSEVAHEHDHDHHDH
jgi:predicted Fe-Mo cluster-binding NifX family protein